MRALVATLIGLCLLIALAIGAAFALPYLAAHRIEAAARAHDAATLAGLSDMAEVDANLPPTLRVKDANRPPPRRRSFFVRFLAHVFGRRRGPEARAPLDAAALAALLGGRGPASRIRLISEGYHGDGDHFHAVLQTSDDRRLTLTLERRGLTHWRLIDIAAPKAPTPPPTTP